MPWLIVLVKSVILLFVVVTSFAYAMLAERKILGWMQMRPGPNRVGPWGLLQPAADAAKLILKKISPLRPPIRCSTSLRRSFLC